MLKLVHTDTDAVDACNELEEASAVDLDELCRMAAQQMLATALLAERQAYLDAHADHVDATGKRVVVANGYARQRDVVTGAGPVTVEAPRVNDKRDGEKFSSGILPAYMRRSPKVTEVLPVLYLRGLSTGDFAPALAGFLGSDAGLSPSTISRLTEAWQAEHGDWAERDLSDRDYVYWWADGVHFNVRLEQDRLCCLVIVGVRPDGSKELIALADGYREDTESWLDLLRGLKARGLAGPSLATGDGALGFWGALREVFPAATEQRCWVHVTANVLAALPKRLQADAKTAIARIYSAQTRTDAITAVRVFADEFAEFPKATRKITGKLDTLLAFYDFPAEHWIHLRTTNPIESTFSTVRLRTRVTRGAGSRAAALAMAYKLLDAAQHRWRRINAPHLVPLVRAGAVFNDGKLQERTTNQPNTQEGVAA
ncbi:MAG: IS256 family transposase [Sulfitobacter sp.]|nr:IS256 family transposase [Sulfitobacter sp.]MCP4086565.1 IS256 family transposase [Actinomycetes bacterium]